MIYESCSLYEYNTQDTAHPGVISRYVSSLSQRRARTHDGSAALFWQDLVVMFLEEGVPLGVCFLEVVKNMRIEIRIQEVSCVAYFTLTTENRDYGVSCMSCSQ